jgi:hypothetical protein
MTHVTGARVFRRLPAGAARGALARTAKPPGGVGAEGLLIFPLMAARALQGGWGVRPEHRRSPKNTRRDAAFRASKKSLSHHAETSLCRRCAAR